MSVVDRVSVPSSPVRPDRPLVVCRSGGGRTGCVPPAGGYGATVVPESAPAPAPAPDERAVPAGRTGLPRRVWWVAGSPRVTGVAALTLLAGAGAVVGWLHVAAGVSPVRGMVSDYVFTPVGAAWLPVGVLLFVGALVVLCRGLVTAGLAGAGAVALLVTSAVGGGLVAMCRADATGAPSTPLGVTHKVGGLLLFGGLPVAAWLVTRRLVRDRRLVLALRAGCVAAVLVMAALLFSYLPLYGVVAPLGGVLAVSQGLLERGVLVAEVAVLVALAVRLVAARRRAVSG